MLLLSDIFAKFEAGNRTLMSTVDINESLPFDVLSLQSSVVNEVEIVTMQFTAQGRNGEISIPYSRLNREDGGTPQGFSEVVEKFVTWLCACDVTMGVGTKSLNQAIECFNLWKSLSKGEVSFQFRKADGTIRDAMGTLEPAVVSKFIKDSATPRKTSNVTATVVYYDLESQGFRSFNPQNLIISRGEVNS